MGKTTPTGIWGCSRQDTQSPCLGQLTRLQGQVSILSSIASSPSFLPYYIEPKKKTIVSFSSYMCQFYR